MPAQIVLLVPLGEMPSGPVDPGYGIPGPPPTVGGGPIMPPPGIWPSPGHPGHPLPQPPGQVGGGPILPPGVDNSLPPGVAPPIALPTPPGPPPTVWPPVGSVMPPIALPPHTPDHTLPKPAPGYIVAWVPGYGFTYVKLGMDVANPIAPGGPAPAPKVG